MYLKALIVKRCYSNVFLKVERRLSASFGLSGAVEPKIPLTLNRNCFVFCDYHVFVLAPQVAGKFKRQAASMLSPIAVPLFKCAKNIRQNGYVR
jgi:hypothetical protein